YRIAEREDRTRDGPGAKAPDRFPVLCEHASQDSGKQNDHVFHLVLCHAASEPLGYFQEPTRMNGAHSLAAENGRSLPASERSPARARTSCTTSGSRCAESSSTVWSRPASAATWSARAFRHASPAGISNSNRAS